VAEKWAGVTMEARAEEVIRVEEGEYWKILCEVVFSQ